MAVTEEILGQFLGDESFPVTWDSEVEKDFFWVYDDLHSRTRSARCSSTSAAGG